MINRLSRIADMAIQILHFGFFSFMDRVCESTSFESSRLAHSKWNLKISWLLNYQQWHFNLEWLSDSGWESINEEIKKNRLASTSFVRNTMRIFFFEISAFIIYYVVYEKFRVVFKSK